MRALQDELRPFAPRRSRSCGVARAYNVEQGSARYVHVVIRATENGPHGHYHGTVRCGSWSACPVCSWAIRGERAKDVTRCVQWWREQGGAVELLTLTFAHSMGDELRPLRVAMQRCWRMLFAGDSGKKLRRDLGIEHYVRGTDDTYGRNGWHPHLHVVLFTRPAGNRARAVAQLRARWHACVLKHLGRHHVPSWSRGADVRECHRDEYIAKLGLELTSAQTKVGKGETPWDIARRAAAGDQGAVELWMAYCAATHGVRQLVWSRKVRNAAGLGAEQTDQEIADAVDNDAEETLVASIPAPLWDRVAYIPGAPFAIISAAEDRGRMGVAEQIGLFTLGLAPPEPGEDPDQLVLQLFDSIAPCDDARPAVTRAAA